MLNYYTFILSVAGNFTAKQVDITGVNIKLKVAYWIGNKSLIEGIPIFDNEVTYGGSKGCGGILPE